MTWVALIGGMYTVFFTPVEAASVGAFLTFLAAAWRRSLNWQASKAVIMETMNATAPVFMIIIGAFVFIPSCRSPNYRRNWLCC